MATNLVWEAQEALLRQLDLNAIIPTLWPEARGPKSDGGGWQQWQFPDDLKVNVAPDGKGFTAWTHRDIAGRTNDRGPTKGTYAGMLVQAVEGGGFRGAMERLHDAGLLSAEYVAHQPERAVTGETAGKKGNFQFRFDFARPYQPVRDYLVGQRGLPESIVRIAWDQGQIQKGYGPISEHYLLFPCRDWSVPGGKLTGALKRWIDPVPPENPEYLKMSAPGTDKKAGWWQLSQNNTPQPILVITEQPIDALSVMAAAEQVGQADQIAVAGFGGQGGLAAKLITSSPRILIATDHDRAGVGYATEISRMAQRLGVERVASCLPPPGQDWNEWWQVDPKAATHQLATALMQVREKQRGPVSHRR